MPRKASGPKLAVIGAAPPPVHPDPPGKLGETGMALWRAVVANYEFADPGSFELIGPRPAGAPLIRTAS
jgi:hypothetical protein